VVNKGISSTSVLARNALYPVLPKSAHDRL
jgi:hypothetical protein